MSESPARSETAAQHPGRSGKGTAGDVLGGAVGARHHAGLREFYRGLRARGKPGRVALTAAMRKLAMHLNAIAIRGTPWSPAHILALAA